MEVAGSPTPEVASMVAQFKEVWREYLYMKHPTYGGQRLNPFPTRKAATAAPIITVSLSLGIVTATPSSLLLSP